MSSTPTLLENDPQSRCFGCGPANEHGLKLSFAREDETVSSTYRVTEDDTGWPGRFHAGLMFTMLMETAYWTIIGIHNQIGMLRGPVGLDISGLPNVGVLVKTVGRITAATDSVWTVLSVAQNEKGRVLATLNTSWSRVTAADADRLHFTDAMRVHVPGSRAE
jgi:hypothetical protein